MYEIITGLLAAWVIYQTILAVLRRWARGAGSRRSLRWWLLGRD